MRIPLSEFELHVRPEPLERGLNIFERGEVEDLRRVGKGKVEATISDGDQTWQPHLTIQNEVVTEAECGCEESGQGICQHAAALIFALQSGEFPEGISSRSGKMPKEKAPAKGRGRPKIGDEPAAPKAKKATAKKPKPPKTPADILGIVSHEDLKAFVLEQCQGDKAFATRLKAHFAELMPAATPAEIKKRIAEMVSASIVAKGRGKQLNFKQLQPRVKDWLKEGMRFVDLQEFGLAFAVGKHLWESMDRLSFDYNHQEIALLLQETTAFILRLGKEQFPEESRKEIFDKSMETLFAGRVLASPFLALASKICTTGVEYGKVAGHLEAYASHSEPQMMELYWEMVKRVKGEEAGKELATKHRTHPYFLKANIQRALDENRLNEALKLVDEGIRVHAGFYLHRKFDWMLLKDKVLAALGDVDARIRLRLEAHNLNIRDGELSLKSIVEIAGKSRWEEERLFLADNIAVRQHPDAYALANLFAVDDDWDAMLEFLKRYKVTRIPVLARNLVGIRPDDLAALIATQLEEAMATKVRITEHDLGQLAVMYAQCKSREETVEFFKGLVTRFPASMVLGTFMRTINRVFLQYHNYHF